MRADALLREKGTTLLITLVTLSALSLMTAAAARRILPRLPMAYQNAAWEEARLAAEAGIDMAMNDLINNVAGPDTNFWVGWKQNASDDGSGNLAAAPPPALLDPVGLVLNLLALTPLAPPPVPVGTAPSPLARPRPVRPAPAGPATSVTATVPIFVNNLQVSTPTGIPTELDVKLWALSTGTGHLPWFRIRSIGTCALPPVAYKVPEPLDAAFRRLSLRNERPTLLNDKSGDPGTIPVPNVSRVAEVLVEPIRPFELALWGVHSVRMGMFGGWIVDSYDSTNPAKSNAGAYPGRDSPNAQMNGDVACSLMRPPDDLYGTLISVNGSVVQGAVATNGGDDPDTPQHENVFGADSLDQSRIRDDFSRTMNPVQLPAGAFQTAPADSIFQSGPVNAPTQYLVSGNLTSLQIKAPGPGINGLIVIAIDGDLILAGPLIVPPSVTAVFYIRGNISFSDNVNSGPWNSNQPSHLLIFGECDTATHQRLDVHGNVSVCAAFYGPKCDITMDGAVDWCGSIAGYDFQVNGSGNGGIHYDESLAVLGPPISFRIVRYIEDVRE